MESHPFFEEHPSDESIRAHIAAVRGPGGRRSEELRRIILGDDPDSDTVSDHEPRNPMPRNNTGGAELPLRE